MSETLPQGFWYTSLDSTMDEARRLIQAGRIVGTGFVVAEHQTQGRGTQGRTWVSPAGKGLYLSIVHRSLSETPFEATPIFTLAAGVACVEILAEIANVSCRLKPINDIYYDGKKLGGILVESELRQQGLASIITGIGINLNRCERMLSQPHAAPISLEEILPPEAFSKLSSEQIIEPLVLRVCQWYTQIFEGHHRLVTEAWETLKQ